jgi:nitrous oxidase accessory protein
VTRPLAYLAGRLAGWQRVLVGLVGAALVPVMLVPVLPIWKIFLVAPQYREGLEMRIFVNDLQGDLRNINILNHYIGMQTVDPSVFPEFGYMPWMISAFGAVALLAALVGRRWLAFLGWAGFAVFGTVMMTHFASWLHEYGTNLDPKAALDFGAFTPPLIGTAHRGNFTIQSLPHLGGCILLGAGLLGPVLVGVDAWRFLRTRRPDRAGALAAAAAGFLLAAVPARAGEFTSYGKPPTPNPLQTAVAAAAPGDTVTIPDGVHRGQLVIDRPLVVRGSAAAVLDGEGVGSVVVVRAAGTVLSGFTVRGSGPELLFDDSGILVDEADGVRMEHVVLVDNNHGIYVRNAAGVVITGCRLEGRRGRVHEENHGNGIHLWHAPGARISANDVSGHRDGVYLSFAESARVRGNLFHGQDRFGLHSMYSQRNEIADNAFVRNTAGTALMFSNRMAMRGNLFLQNRGHRTYGLLLRDCSDSEFVHNRIVDNTIGLFLDGSNRNRFSGNVLSENGWGVIAYSSSENNVFTRNAFLSNDYQMSLDMRRTNNRLSDGGAGNYWSEARPYDLDGDGLGDAPHHPVGFFAFVSKQYPDLTVFSGSPAVVALDSAQRSLPALHPTEMADPHPLLVPPEPPPYRGPAVPGRRGRGNRPLVGLVAGVLAAGGTAALGLRR